jgi:hypothetical protein
MRCIYLGVFLVVTPSHIRIRVAYVSCASQVSRVWYGDRNRSLRRRTECTDSYRTLPFSTTSTQGQGSCHHLRVTIPGLQTRARPPPTEDQATVAKPARAAAQVSVRPCPGRRPPRTPCTVHLSLHVQTHTYYGWSPAAQLFVWLISHQPSVLFSQNKPASSNFLLEQNSSGHQPQPNQKYRRARQLLRHVGEGGRMASTYWHCSAAPAGSMPSRKCQEPGPAGGERHSLRADAFDRTRARHDTKAPCLHV